MEFTVLKSPKGFGDLFQRSHSFLNSFLDPNLKTRLPNHWYPFPLHSQGLMPCKQQSDILTPSPRHRRRPRRRHWPSPSPPPPPLAVVAAAAAIAVAIAVAAATTIAATAAVVDCYVFVTPTP
jgi:hypothetical protein